MSAIPQSTQTMNTPHPYGDGGYAASGLDADTTPAAQTHGVGASVDTTSKPNIATTNTNTTQSKPGPPMQSNSSIGSQSQVGNVGGRKDTHGVSEPVEDESGAARGTGTGAAGGEDAPSNSGQPEGGYPEQLHAGKLDGLGPEYGKTHRVTIGDRLQGVKEEIKGTVKRDPELKNTGKERMTGELKRKQIAEEGKPDTIANTADSKDSSSEKKDEPESGPKKTRTEKTDEPGLTEHPQAHPTEKGRQEQAASIESEDTEPSGQTQRAKENAEGGQVS